MQPCIRSISATITSLLHFVLSNQKVTKKLNGFHITVCYAILTQKPTVTKKEGSGRPQCTAMHIKWLKWYHRKKATLEPTPRDCHIDDTSAASFFQRGSHQLQINMFELLQIPDTTLYLNLELVLEMLYLVTA